MVSAMPAYDNLWSRSIQGRSPRGSMDGSRRTRGLVVAGLSAVVLLVAAACGTTNPAPSATTATTMPLTTSTTVTSTGCPTAGQVGSPETVLAVPGCRYVFSLGQGDVVDLAITIPHGAPAPTAPGPSHIPWILGGDGLGMLVATGPGSSIALIPGWLSKMAATPFASSRADVTAMPADYLAYLRTMPGLSVSAPQAVSLGGLKGQVVSISVGTLPPEAARAVCNQSGIYPCIMLEHNLLTSIELNQGDIGEIAVLDTPSGQIEAVWDAPATTDPATIALHKTAFRSIELRTS